MLTIYADYHIKEKRRVAVERLRTKMLADGIDPAPTCEDVVKKINNLRTYYNAERNKEEASKV